MAPCCYMTVKSCRELTEGGLAQGRLASGEVAHPLSLISSSLSVLASQLPLSRLWNLCSHNEHNQTAITAHHQTL